jgi:fatty acyl-CoA reductase
LFEFPQIFELVKRDRPQNLKKIVPLPGDCSELGLGLSARDRQLLEETVSIVFHAAANIRFDNPLKSAAILNARGAREVMLIARNMKKLKVTFAIIQGCCKHIDICFIAYI